WIQKMTRRAGITTSIYTLIISIVYIFSGYFLLNFWMGKDIEIFNILFFPGLFYMIYLLINAWISYIMLSTPYLKSLLKIYPAAVVVAVAGKYYFAIEYGAEGLIWAE